MSSKGLPSWPESVKKTKNREQVFEILKEADRPLTVIDILERLHSRGITAWHSTVYRALELFQKSGVVNRIMRQHSDMAFYELNTVRHQHYATCLDCHEIFPLEQCPLDLYTEQLEAIDFKVRGHNLEIYGYCDNCEAEHEDAKSTDCGCDHEHHH